MKVAYAGDRDIAVWVLEFLLSRGVKPLALMVSDDDRATHSGELIKMCSHLKSERILKGADFREEKGIKILSEIKPDYIIGVHFPYMVPKNVLEIPKFGFLNLHPAYLPYNRGWNTPSWAIFENTPYGATLHFMDEGLDTGDIIHQKRMGLMPYETADSLYRRVKKIELEVFKEAWPLIEKGRYKRIKQTGNATTYSSKDLQKIQEIDMDKKIKAEELIRLLRALTTNKKTESAYFNSGGKKYRVRISIEEDDK